MKEISIGILFFLFLAFLFQVTIIEKTNLDKEYPYKMRMYFSRADGIKEGQDVYLLGTKFGIIKEIHKIDSSLVPDKRLLEKGKDKAIEIVIAVKEPITLWDNYEIKFKSKTAFSGRTLDINPGNFSDEVQGSFNPTYTNNEYGTKKSPSGKYYDDFFSAANTTLKENEIELRKTILNLKEISHKLNQKEGSLPKFLNEDIAYIFLDETTNDAKLTLREFRRYQETTREADTIFIPFSLVLYRQLFDSVNQNWK